METKTITTTLVHVYFLNLNRMTDRCESCKTVAVSTEYNDLMQWYQEQLDPNGPDRPEETNLDTIISIKKEVIFTGTIHRDRKLLETWIAGIMDSGTVGYS